MKWPSPNTCLFFVLHSSGESSYSSCWFRSEFRSLCFFVTIGSFSYLKSLISACAVFQNTIYLWHVFISFLYKTVKTFLDVEQILCPLTFTQRNITAWLTDPWGLLNPRAKDRNKLWAEQNIMWFETLQTPVGLIQCSAERNRYFLVIIDRRPTFTFIKIDGPPVGTTNTAHWYQNRLVLSLKLKGFLINYQGSLCSVQTLFIFRCKG